LKQDYQTRLQAELDKSVVACQGTQEENQKPEQPLWKNDSPQNSQTVRQQLLLNRQPLADDTSSNQVDNEVDPTELHIDHNIVPNKQIKGGPILLEKFNYDDWDKLMYHLIHHKKQKDGLAKKFTWL